MDSANTPGAGSMEGAGVTQQISKSTDIEIGTKKDQIMEMSSRICITHPDEKIVFLCEDHQVACCVECMACNHTECSAVLLEEIYFKFSSCLEHVKHIHNSINNGEDGLRIYLKKIENHFNLGVKRIRNVYDEIRQKVDEAEKSAIDQFNILKEVKLSDITCRFKDYAELNEKINSISQEGELLLNKVSTRHVATHSSDSIDLRHSSPNDVSSVCDSPMCSVENTEAMTKYTKVHENELKFIQEKLTELRNCIEGSNVQYISKNYQHMSNIGSSLTEIVSFFPPTQVSRFVASRQITCVGKVHRMSEPSNGELFIVTSNPSKLQHISVNGTVKKSVDLSTYPWDLCVYGSYESLTAVSLRDNRQIICYRTSDFSVLSTIKLSFACYGICRVGNAFVVASCDEGIVESVDDSGGIISSSDKLFRYPTVVRHSTHSNCILVSDEKGHEVVALSPDLKTVLYKMSHTDLGTPCGLCINDYGTVYVCSYQKHCVVEFSDKGNYLSTILPTTQLGISNPFSLWYSNRSRILYVASFHNGIHMFQGL